MWFTTETNIKHKELSQLTVKSHLSCSGCDNAQMGNASNFHGPPCFPVCMSRMPTGLCRTADGPDGSGELTQHHDALMHGSKLSGL